MVRVWIVTEHHESTRRGRSLAARHQTELRRGRDRRLDHKRCGFPRVPWVLGASARNHGQIRNADHVQVFMLPTAFATSETNCHLSSPYWAQVRRPLPQANLLKKRAWTLHEETKCSRHEMLRNYGMRRPTLQSVVATMLKTIATPGFPPSICKRSLVSTLVNSHITVLLPRV